MPLTEDTNETTHKHKMEWSPENEAILVEWGDIGSVYKWLHTRAQQIFSRLHAWYTIPAIVLSTISGTASFAQSSLPTAYQAYSPMVIGGINIGVGILSTIAQYLKISELNESFRVAAIAWDKYSRNIRIELAKAPAERTDAYTFLKISRDEFDRLMETSPSIPPAIVLEFIARFSGVATVGHNDPVKMARFEKLKKPDICDIIISADEHRHPWYKENHRSQDTEEDEDQMEIRIQRDLLKRQELLRQQEDELHEKVRLLNEKEQEAERHRIQIADAAARRVENELHESIRIFIEHFMTNVGRNPLLEEIRDQLGDDAAAAAASLLV
jgi:hypothetical protein